jgi:hypothetical protein
MFMFIRVYNKKEKHIGWFSCSVPNPPELIDFGGNIYQLRPKHGPLIQNDCYIELGKPAIKTMLATEIGNEKVEP